MRGGVLVPGAVSETEAVDELEPRAAEIDAALIARALAGASGVAAFGELYDRHKDEVHGWLVRFLGDPELAEEALQESFFRVYRALETFDPGRSFRPWLHQVVRNTALDLLRARTKARRGAQDERVRGRQQPAPQPLDQLAAREDIADVSEALAALPDETRALLIQRHGLGLKLDELAESWRLNERTLRTRLQRAAGELAALVLQVRARSSARRDSNRAQERGS